MSTSAGVWLGALCTLFMYSYLYKDNPLFKFAEHAFVGISAAHAIVMGYQNIVEMGYKPVVSGKAPWMIVPIILGLLLYTRFSGSGKIMLLSRIPIGFLSGLAAALSIRGLLDASVIKQISGTMGPIKSINDVVVLIGVVTTISYFVFTAGGRKGPVGASAEVGRYVIMITFGSAFGNTVMARMSLVIGRLQFLFGQWIQIIK